MDDVQKLTLAMSGSALIISTWVAWQSYRNRRIKEATSKAIVTVESAQLTKLLSGAGEIELTPENSGKAFAHDVKVTN